MKYLVRNKQIHCMFMLFVLFACLQSPAYSSWSWKNFSRHALRATARGMIVTGAVCRGMSQSYGNGIGTYSPYQSNAFRTMTYGQVIPTGGTMSAQTIGNTTFINGPGLQSATAQQIGNTTFVNGPGLSSTTIQKIGNTDFINGSGGFNATAQHIGNTTFINGSDGTATLQRIGNTTFINGPNGQTGTAMNIGNSTFVNY